MTQQYDFSFVQGDTFTQTWAFGSSLSGYTARMKLKETPESQAAIELDETDGITLSGTNVTVTIAAADSADIESGRYLYDLKLITSGGVVSTFRKGYVDVIAQISDDD